MGSSCYVGTPRFLTPYRPKNRTSWDPYPLRAGTPLPAGTPPLLHLFAGPCSRGGPGSRLLELWAVWAWECHKPGLEPRPPAFPDASKWQPRAGPALSRYTVQCTLCRTSFPRAFGLSRQNRATPPSRRGIAPPLPQRPGAPQVKLPLPLKKCRTTRGCTAALLHVVQHFAI